MSLAATWMDLESVILSEVRKRKTNVWYHLYAYDSTYMWTLKYSTGEQIHKTKQTYRRGCQGEGRWVREGLGVWDQWMQTIIYKMVQHRELYFMSCDKP